MTFKDRLRVDVLGVDSRTGRQQFQLAEPFRWELQRNGKSKAGATIEIVVPAGYVTDFASVPRLFWRIVPPFGKYSPAAVVHDFLCDLDRFPRSVADAMFLAAMAEVGVPLWKRWSMFVAVRLFAFFTFRWS